MRWSSYSFLVCAVLFVGCQSGETEQAPPKSKTGGETAAQTEGPGEVSQSMRSESPAENDRRAKELVDAMMVRLEDERAFLKSEIQLAASEAEQRDVYNRLNPIPTFLSKVNQIVEVYPESPASLDAALSGLGYAEGAQRNQLMDYLLKQWPTQLNHRKLVEYLLEQVPSSAVESWLEQVIAAAPEGVVKAEALLGYKTFFDQKTIYSSTLKQNPAFEARISSEQLAYIHAELSAQQRSKISSYLARLQSEYGDLDFTGSGLGSSDTFGEVAKYELFELENLNVGDVAPDIVGQDLDGSDFKLSDYRGKVVMLDFWGQWCPPCRRMYPYERELVRRMSGLPFALLGVNSDRDLEVAKASVRDEKLPWRNFWNGPEGTAGPIAKLYNVSEWPTVYLIDADGVIRFKCVLGNDIEKGIEQLMAELGHSIDLEPVTKVATPTP